MVELLLENYLLTIKELKRTNILRYVGVKHHHIYPQYLPVILFLANHMLYTNLYLLLSL